MAPMAMRVTEMGASEGCPVIGQIEVASPRGDKITSPETELTSCWCSARELLRNRCMKQSKCRWRKPLVQLHTRPVDFPSPRESAASPYRVGLLRFESGCVLVFQGGVFGCSSRMNGNPSSPVLRGLGASNGARLLDPNGFTAELPVTRGVVPIKTKVCRKVL